MSLVVSSRRYTTARDMDLTICQGCDLTLQPWRVGLHLICHRCEIDHLRLDPDYAPDKEEAWVEHWNQRQASQAVQEGLRAPYKGGWPGLGWPTTPAQLILYADDPEDQPQ